MVLKLKNALYIRVVLGVNFLKFSLMAPPSNDTYQPSVSLVCVEKFNCAVVDLVTLVVGSSIQPRIVEY